MASFFNLEQMEDFESYGEHLFGLGHRFVHFCQEGDLQGQENKLQTRISSSDKTGSEARSEAHSAELAFLDSQIQTNFLKEHNFILQKYIRNYKSLFLKQEQFSSTPKGGYEQLSLADALLALRSQIQTLAGTNLQIAFSGMIQHEKVMRFLKEISQNFEQNIRSSLLKMSMLVWVEYFRLNAKNLVERDIIEFSSRLLSYSFLQKLKTLLPTYQNSGDLPRIKEFFNVFVNTFLFVAFEYFVNPYYQLEEELLVKEYQNYQLFLYDTSVNDQDEDDGEYEQLKGRKLVKLTSFTQEK